MMQEVGIGRVEIGRCGGSAPLIGRCEGGLDLRAERRRELWCRRIAEGEVGA